MKEEVKSALIISITVIIILVITYFLTALFATNEFGGNNKSKKEESYLKHDYDNMITASSTFSKSENEYMVLFFSEKKMSETLKLVLKSYDSKEDAQKLYKVNTDESINSYVLSNDENIKPASSSDLKVKVPTLIKIKNGGVTEYINNESQILNLLK